MLNAKCVVSCTDQGKGQRRMQTVLCAMLHLEILAFMSVAEQFSKNRSHSSKRTSLFSTMICMASALTVHLVQHSRRISGLALSSSSTAFFKGHVKVPLSVQN